MTRINQQINSIRQVCIDAIQKHVYLLHSTYPNARRVHDLNLSKDVPNVGFVGIINKDGYYKMNGLYVDFSYMTLENLGELVVVLEDCYTKSMNLPGSREEVKRIKDYAGEVW